MSSLRKHNLETQVVRDEVITVAPNVLSGAPVFTDTRVPVKALFDYLAEGNTLDEFFKDFPSVSFEQVSALFKRLGEQFDVE